MKDNWASKIPQYLVINIEHKQIYVILYVLTMLYLCILYIYMHISVYMCVYIHRDTHELIIKEKVYGFEEPDRWGGLHGFVDSKEEE